MSETCCCKKQSLRLNLGCGSNILDGWKNDDGDIRTALSVYQTGSVEFILVEHVLEHLTGPEGLRFLEECHRVLKAGGVLRLCVPILQRIKDRNHCRDLILGHGHQMVYCQRNLCEMLWVAGFEQYQEKARSDCDGHHKVIGVEKDDLETFRIEAIK